MGEATFPIILLIEIVVFASLFLYRDAKNTKKINQLRNELHNTKLIMYDNAHYKTMYENTKAEYMAYVQNAIDRTKLIAEQAAEINRLEEEIQGMDDCRD